MTIQWHARTFHAFGRGDGNRLIYDVPCGTENNFNDLYNDVRPLRILNVELIKPGTLRVEVKY